MGTMASDDSLPEAGLLPSDGSSIFTYQADNHPSQLLSKMAAMRSNGRYTDVVLKAGDITIKCHKVVLSAASEYFDHRLDGALGSLTTISFSRISPDILEAMVNIIYSIPISLCAHKVKPLAEASNILGMQDMKGTCDQFISDHVNGSNVLGLLRFGMDQKLSMTTEKALQFVYTYLEDVIEKTNDAELLALKEEALIRIISSDDLEVSNEELVFKFVEKWVQVSPKPRNDSLSRIMPHVRFPLMDAEHLLCDIQTNPLMKSEKCQALVDEAKNSFILPKLKATLPGSRGKARNASGSQALIVLGGGETVSDSNTTCWAMSLDGSKSEVIAELPNEQKQYPWNMAACVVGDELYITGGNKDCNVVSDCTNAMWQLSLTTKTWQSLPSMNQARGAHAMAILGSNLYVCGGFCAGSLSSAEKYDMKTQEWTQLADMKESTCHCSAVCLDSDMFVVDGRQSLLHQYNPSSNSWELKMEMPDGSSWLKAVQHQGEIYVVGGTNDFQCMKYKPSTDQWCILSNPSVASHYHAAVVHNNKILLAGGYDGEQFKNSLEEYDPNTDTWTDVALTLPKQLACHNMLLTKYSFGKHV